MKARVAWSTVLLLGAGAWPAAFAHPLRGDRRPIRTRVHPQLRRGETRVPSREHRAPAPSGSTTTTTVCWTSTSSAAGSSSKGMHPYPLRKPPQTPARNHLFRNDGNGKFTDVTDAGRCRRRPLQHGRHRRRLRQRRQYGPARHRLRPRHPLPQQRRRHLRRCHRQSGPAGPRLVDRRRLARLRPRRLRRPLHRPLREVRPRVSLLLRRRQLSRAARL